MSKNKKGKREENKLCSPYPYLSGTDSQSRRNFLSTLATASAVAVASKTWGATSTESSFPVFKKAQIAITLDLEMARNFPNWEDTHWDYEKGNLNQAAKDYTVEACRRVKERGGLIHPFVVGQVFEQENIDWLKGIVAEGHPLGNHTYDHVYLLADKLEQVQYRFRRAPWLLDNLDVPAVLHNNIVLTNKAIETRLGIEVNGFRTPGGFATGLNDREDLQRMILDIGFEWVSCRYPTHRGMVPLKEAERPSRLAFDQILAAQRDAQPHLYPTGLLELPMSPVSDIGAFRNGRWQLKHFKEAIRLGMDWAIENHAVYDFLAHPSCLGVVDKKFEVIDMICDMVDQSGGKAEIVTLDVIAKRARVQLETRGELK